VLQSRVPEACTTGHAYRSALNAKRRYNYFLFRHVSEISFASNFIILLHLSSHAVCAVVSASVGMDTSGRVTEQYFQGSLHDRGQCNNAMPCIAINFSFSFAKPLNADFAGSCMADLSIYFEPTRSRFHHDTVHDAVYSVVCSKTAFLCFHHAQWTSTPNLKLENEWLGGAH
jgi:hypothetical protein